MSKKQKSLDELCKEIGIERKTLTEEDMKKYRNNDPGSEEVLNSMLEVNKILEGNAIVIGGSSVHPKLLGFRKMRKLSNDLDCITDEKGIRTLYENFKDKLFQTTNYGDVFMEYKSLPFGFDTNETHGWEIPEDFFSDAVEFNLTNPPLKTISPEYIITLKSRRAMEKGRVFGKDKLDTANVILAPYFKEEKEKKNYVDIEKTASLMRRHSFGNLEGAKDYIESLGQARDHLKKSEREIFSENISQLKNQINKEYRIIK
ncbi:MAG: hypothetical protein ACOC1P_04730 [Minisyncoccales bacterium]